MAGGGHPKFVVAVDVSTSVGAVVLATIERLELIPGVPSQDVVLDEIAGDIACAGTP